MAAVGRVLTFALLGLVAAPPGPGAAMAAPLASGAAAAEGADSAKEQLDRAKAARAEARNKARAALVEAIDAQIKTAGSAGDLETLKALTAQKDAFATAAVPPNLPALKDAVAQYTQATRKADGELVAAYEVAIESFTKAGKSDEAIATRKERQALLEGKADAPTPDTPEAVGVLFDRSKIEYQRAVADAKKALLAAIDARINAASDAGDLNNVTKIQAARSAADAEQPYPDGFNDPQCLGARSRYNLAILAANQKLAGAYREAIRNYTRVRAIDRAQALQAEFDATGLSAPPPAGGSGGIVAPAGGGSGEAPTRLIRLLPYYLAASGAYASDKDGIRPAKGTILATKAANFLSKDFVFDVYVTVPKDEEWVVVGLGDMTEKGSIRVVIRNDGGWGRRAFLTHGDEWGTHFGDIHAGEPYVVRLERHEGPVTASVGTFVDGKFNAEMSQTIGDPKAIAPTVTERRAHLFFGGASALYTQVRLATGTAAGAPGGGGGGGAAPPAGAPAGRFPTTVVKFPQPGEGNGSGGAAAPSVTPPPARAADDEAAKGIFRLNTDKLPPAFMATGTFGISPAGLKPHDEKCLITSKAEDFLTKDFILEATVDVPAKLMHDELTLGLGDGSDKGSVRLLIRADGGWGTRAFLATGDRWGKNFGDLREAGTRTLRIERHGTAVTVSVGTENNGKFEPEMSQTVADPKAIAPDLSERRSHLFFTGKANWSRLRLLTGDAANAEPAPPPTGAPASGKGPRKK